MLTQRRRIIAKKLAHGVKRKRAKIEMEIAQEFFLEHEEEFDDGIQQDKLLNIPLEYISMLSPQERKQLRQQYPNMPAYLFMSKRQKKKYFDNKNQEYRKRLESISIKKAKEDKKVKFKPIFQVKPFESKQKVNNLGEKKSFTEKYQPQIHFS